jgi:hypothetical protein
MAVTALWANRSEYCRYQRDLSLIGIRGTLDSGHADAPVVVSLAVYLTRSGVYAQVAQQTVTASGTDFAATFDLNGPLMQDQYGINRAIAGDYQIIASDGDVSTPAASIDTVVSLVTAQDMRRKWAYGQTLFASEVVLPVQQPRVLPATFTLVSKAFLKGAYPLVYTASGHTFSYAGGPPAAVTPGTGTQHLVLADARGDDYVEVDVDTGALPSGTTTETIMLDEARMSDRDIIEMVRLKTAELENYFGFFVEPHLCVSEQLRDEYPTWEIATDSAGYYGTFGSEQFPTIDLPLAMLLVIISLRGFFNAAQTTTIPDNWMQRNEMGGAIELVPTSGQSLAIIFSGFPISLDLNNYLSVPNFWQYAVIAGCRDLWEHRGVIREAVAKAAAIDLLIQAGGAYKAGISSSSTSRDGVSFSQSYTSSAQFGPFAHFTIPYGEWLDKKLPEIKRGIVGLSMVTLR